MIASRQTVSFLGAGLCLVVLPSFLLRSNTSIHLVRRFGINNIAPSISQPAYPLSALSALRVVQGCLL